MNHQSFLDMNRIRRALLVVMLLTVIIASSILLIRPIARNQAFHQALKAVLSNPANYNQALSDLNPVISDDCRINWQIILLTLIINKPADIEDNQSNLLECTPNSIDWLMLSVPQREDLAQRAVQLYPDQPRAWFWLGELATTTGDSLQAEKDFAESVRLDPTYGLAWCRLGGLKERQGQINTAEEAYLQCCENGDPGSNGCYGAGRMAEKLNDVPAAIQFYRRSHWSGALQRAEALETIR